MIWWYPMPLNRVFNPRRWPTLHGNKRSCLAQGISQNILKNKKLRFWTARAARPCSMRRARAWIPATAARPRLMKRARASWSAPMLDSLHREFSAFFNSFFLLPSFHPYLHKASWALKTPYIIQISTNLLSRLLCTQLNEKHIKNTTYLSSNDQFKPIRSVPSRYKIHLSITYESGTS